MPDAGKLVLSRPVVYPAATAVDGRPRSACYVRAGFSEEHPPVLEATTACPSACAPAWSCSRARRRAGSRRHVAPGYRPAFSWSARSDSGRPSARAGTYRPPADDARRSGQRAHDPACGRGLGRAADRADLDGDHDRGRHVPTSGRAPIYDPGCIGCGEVCGPVPSDRFPGGLSFRQPCSFGYAAVRYFAAAAPVVPAPVDAFRVSATGGPTTPGDTDVAHFDATRPRPWRRDRRPRRGSTSTSTPTRTSRTPSARSRWAVSTSAGERLRHRVVHPRVPVLRAGRA